ncbi:MAG: SCO family protein [Ahniella sp.]|nr:SCO family protein [Ahniella sp.]
MVVPTRSADLQGHWTLMYFGFLQCPDVCPTTLASMAALRRRIEADPGSVAVPRLVFVTVDPENDSASAMAAYTSFFDPGIVGVRAEPASLRGFADQLGVFYEEQIDERGVRSMAHTTSVLLIDPSGRGVAAFSATHDLRVFERQYRQMLEHVSSR